MRLELSCGGLEDFRRVVAEHRVRLASARLSVHEDGAVDAVERAEDDLLRGVVEQLLVVGLGVEAPRYTNQFLLASPDPDTY